MAVRDLCLSKLIRMLGLVYKKYIAVCHHDIRLFLAGGRQVMELTKMLYIETLVIIRIKTYFKNMTN